MREFKIDEESKGGKDERTKLITEKDRQKVFSPLPPLFKKPFEKCHIFFFYGKKRANEQNHRRKEEEEKKKRAVKAILLRIKPSPPVIFLWPD